MGVKYDVALYEADAQLQYLEMKGEFHGIITEDSDLLVYGARNILFKMDPSGHCIHICRDKLGQVDDKRMGPWDERQFRQMAMLSGCDYLSSINSNRWNTIY
ncbi:Rad2 nuclease [Puccinia graminis f. sp. tritici]|uniref:Rad2 nuclease n=1 Tax=Puccinia graminis f. sp. tritici TaxID=56615 RepID=A0A5B0SMD3_PUCGR|nr:Rad2 nuclease [Puccinia graminis f. sp. tritici]